MKVFFSLIFSFLLSSCMQTPDVPFSKEKHVQTKIQNNKSEANRAKEAYLKLQKQRNNE